MTFLNLILLAVVQGLAELLPISSSAHVILAQKFMGLDPTAPEMSFLLVMLHTGTMFAVLFYFWGRWKKYFFSWDVDGKRRWKFLILATGFTGVLGLGLKWLLEKVIIKQEIEMLFDNLGMIGLCLILVGVLIVVAGFVDRRLKARNSMGVKEAIVIGMVQGLCLPFRGFSRSGATISAGLLQKLGRIEAEEFSFALALLLTPPVLFHSFHRLNKYTAMQTGEFMDLHHLEMGALGAIFAFAAGLVALKLLSSLLEKGEWRLFGYYDILAGATIILLSQTYFV